MKVKVFERDISIKLQFQGDELPDKFIKFKNKFRESEFKITSIGLDNKPWISDPSSKEDYLLFRIMVVDYEEKKFYDFLQKFCEENGITFEIPVETTVKPTLIGYGELIEIIETYQNHLESDIKSEE